MTGRHHGLFATTLFLLTAGACAPRTNFYPFGDAASTAADAQSDASVTVADDGPPTDVSVDVPLALPDAGAPVDDVLPAPDVVTPPDVLATPDVLTTSDVAVVTDVGFDAGFDVGFDAGFDVPDVPVRTDVGLDVPDTGPTAPACSAPPPTSTPYNPPRLTRGACTAEQIAYYYPLTGPSPGITADDCGRCVHASDPADPTWGSTISIPGMTQFVNINIGGCLAITEGGAALTATTTGCGPLGVRLNACTHAVCVNCGAAGTPTQLACRSAALSEGGACGAPADAYLSGCSLSDARVNSCTQVPAEGTPERVRYLRALLNAFCGNGLAPADNTACAVPSCAGRVCGSDGCGGSCGTCAAGFTCTAAGDHCL